MIHPDAFRYQQDGAEWLAPRANACLFDGMGVGKTAQAIWGADIAGHKRILVLCPGIARVNWQREFEQWQTVPRTLGLITDRKSVPDTDVVISSYSTIMSRSVLEKLLSHRWQKLICDESHYLKNPNALRTQIVFGGDCQARKGLAANSDGTWLLTGTPFPNGPHEAWTFSRALFPQTTKGLENYLDWETEFCVTQPGTWGNRIMAARNVIDFTQRLKPHILRRLLDVVQPDLPPARFGHVAVSPDKLPEGSSEEIDTVIRAAQTKQGLASDFDAQAWVDSAQMSSLRRWTGVAKAPAVAEFLREDIANGLQKLVVFAVHHEVIDILKNGLPGAAIITGHTPEKKRQGIIDAFQGRVAGVNLAVLICNIDIASTALTLTASADVAFAETTWVPKDVLQGVHRCRRLGQKRSVLARVFSLRGSLDEVMGSVLVRKANLIAEAEFGLAA